jgi:hypothetical protein
MLPIVESAIAAGWSEYIRAGPSMVGVLFSTANDHAELSYCTQFPFVTLGIDDSGIFIGWSDYTTFHEPPKKEYVSPTDAMPTLKRYLGELWKRTKNGAQLPGVLT